MRFDLKRNAVSATIWSSVDTFAKQGAHFLISIVLARLLTPADYGTVALLSIFFGIANVFIESGFGTALIQRQEVTDVDLSSVFFFNVIAAFLFSLLLCLASPQIASFYDKPVLMPLTCLMAAGLFVGTFGSIQSIILTKELNFRRLCVISVINVILMGCVAIPMAYSGYGVWSLAVSSFCATCATTIVYWMSSCWRPKFIFSMASIRSLFRFSGFLLISSLLETLFSRLNTLIIGKYYSPTDLGYYSRADGTQQLPASMLSRIISRVAFPVFCASNHDQELLRNGFRRAVMSSMLINVPVMIGMIVTAKPLVLVLFGEQWLASVPYLQILCLSGIFWPLHVLNLKVLNAQGHSNLFFRLEVIKKVFGITALALACYWGIIAIAWSTVVTSVFCFAVNSRYSGVFLKYGALRQCIDLLPCLVVSIVMSICVYAITIVPIQVPFVLLLLQVVVGIVLYIVFCVFFRLSAFIEIVKLFPRLNFLLPPSVKQS